MEELTPGTTTVIHVQEQSMIAGARRRVETLGASMDFTATQTGRLAIAVTELATNLLKHAGGGEILATSCKDAGCDALDLVAIDRGPGISDVAGSLRDGFSTAGSSGTGLGALRRLSSAFDLYTSQGNGTVVFARIPASDTPRPRRPVLVSGVCVPHTGEDVAGDAWCVASTLDTTTLLLCDGLGHGALAAAAAREAVDAFNRSSDAAPADILDEIHSSLRSTRGAVAGVLKIDHGRHTSWFAGVGNITAMIVTDSGTRRLLSHNGTLGIGTARIRENEYPFPARATTILHSDGLTTHLETERYSGLLSRQPGVVCGVLYRDFTRGRDDASVVVARDLTEAP